MHMYLHESMAENERYILWSMSIRVDIFLPLLWIDALNKLKFAKILQMYSALTE